MIQSAVRGMNIHGAVLLIPLLLLPGCIAPQDSNPDAAPILAPIPDPLHFSWSTAKSFGFTGIHFHVVVPEGSHCTADLKATMRLQDEAGPMALVRLEAPGEQGTSGAVWYSGGVVFRAHAPGADSQEFLGLSTGDGPRYASASIHINATVNEGLDAFAIGDLTPRPADSQSVGDEWPGKSVVFAYRCDRPSKLQVSQGSEVVLIDGRNSSGGVGLQATSAVLGATIQDDEVRVKMVSPSVMALGEAIASAGTSTSIKVEAPHASQELSANPTTRPIAKLSLKDGPGDYTVTIQNVQPNANSGYMVALLGTEPLETLDALSDIPKPDPDPCSPNC
jgi:hypothetical protein